MALADRCPSLHGAFHEILVARLRESHDAARSLAHDQVDVRIASTLLRLVPIFSIRGADGFPVLPFTRQELADLTGTTPETAIRATKEMERLGLVDLSRVAKIKVLDLARMRELGEVE